MNGVTDMRSNGPAEPTTSRSTFRGSPVVGYVRSIAGGAEQEALVQQVRSYAHDRGLWIAEVICDQGTSAVAVWRPLLERLIRDLEQCRFSGVIVPALSHLGTPRSGALRVLQRIEATSAWVAFVDT